MNDTYRLERSLARAGLGPVAGADEAGRGACAGPLVAAACILPPSGCIAGLDDSKKLTAKRREELFAEITDKALSFAIVEVSHVECDELGMHEADIQGLRRSLLRLDLKPGYALTDGFPVDGLGMPGLAVWKGDQVAACVAAASILAKVTRDRLMVKMGELYPDYGFEVHKGYVTKAHQHALDTYGPCDIHRRSYANVLRAARLVSP
ncbi:MAG: ribonuclease HII [Propionibacteriaceae bacterium]